ncbi:MAG: potassium channel family protein [Gammaproteobacteria bacterium]|nr:potassium channel family protein [Gammaproteobacteria bacterium]
MNILRYKLLRRPRAMRLARELQLEQGVKVRRLLGLLLALSAVHIVAMMALEGMGPMDAAWLTLTTLTTVGYGDLSAATPLGRLATVLLLYIVGITMLAQLASDYIDYRLERRQRMLQGRWEWNMKDHMLIVNAPKQNPVTYLERLITQVRETPELADLPVQLLTDAFADGLPQNLRDLGVVHRHDSPDHDEAWTAVDLASARYLVVLAHDHHDRRTDSLTFDIVHRALGHMDPARTYVVAECMDDNNRPRLQKLGVNSVVRPIRAYPELMVRAIIAPGVEQVMENLFTHSGDHAQRYELDIRGIRWADIVSTLIQRDWGTAMAFVGYDGEVVCNPPARQAIDARALLLLVREGREPGVGELKAALAVIETDEEPGEAAR